MGEYDPVSWETIEAVDGPPAPEVTEIVEEMRDAVHDETPSDVVKAIHDGLYADERERTVPSLAEPFITAYLLENEGVLDPNGAEREYRSIVEHRPDPDRLRELFWEQERTLWWIGLLVGVHPALVTYWFYEDDIPLMERNLTDESLERIRDYRE